MVILTSKEKMKFIFNFFYNYILNINYEDRKLLCKMCVSDHFLEIERGRYTRIKKENRICKFCDLKEVEDEFHFFFRCKNNHTLRNILYKDINGICPILFCLNV
jgi:superfamily II helicase